MLEDSEERCEQVVEISDEKFRLNENQVFFFSSLFLSFSKYFINIALPFYQDKELKIYVFRVRKICWCHDDYYAIIFYNNYASHMIAASFMK